MCKLNDLFCKVQDINDMYDHKYAEMYNQLMKKREAGEKKWEEEMKIGRKAEADTLAKFKLLYGDIDLNEDDAIADISGANIVTFTPDNSVKGTSEESPNGNHLNLQGASSVNNNTMNVDDLSLKVNVGEQSNINVSKMDDFDILCNLPVYGSFMQLAGIQNETVDLEVLKSPQVVASYVKFTDINIQTSVTKPLASIKCSENSSELKQENIEQSKDDSNVK